MDVITVVVFLVLWVFALFMVARISARRRFRRDMRQMGYSEEYIEKARKKTWF